MNLNALQKALLFLMLLCFGGYLAATAQVNRQLSIQVTTEKHPQKENLLDMMVKISKADSGDFDGYLKVITPTGFTSILGDSIPVSMASDEKIFIPLKIIAGNNITAGNAQFSLQLFSKNKQLILSHNVKYAITANVQLNLFTNQPIINLHNIHDSVQVAVAVSNTGNIGEAATIVFNIPELTGEKNFFEYTGFIDRKKDTVFKFHFLAPEKLLRLDRFTVQVAGLRGAEKELFGNIVITVLNVSSSKRYNNVQTNDLGSLYQSNSITASYRRIGNNVDIYQLMGNTNIDLPAGYVSLNGSLYTLKNDHAPIVSNTYLSYYLNANEIRIGNISRTLEVPFFGRGAEITINNKIKSRGLQAGFIDENFNLIQKSSFLKNGYGFYAVGMFNQQNTLNNGTFNYIFKEDVYEKAMHHVVGSEINHNLGKSDHVKVRLYEGYSKYQSEKNQNFSTAVEVQHIGEYKTIRTSGNYFYSTKYFPGNRRGLLQLQQTFTKSLSNTSSLYASVFASDFAPRSYTYNMNIKSTNIRTDAGINLPRLKKINLTITYQYQHETSNSINRQLNIADTGNLLSMDAHRLASNLNWTSPNQYHSFIIGMDGGMVRYPENTTHPLQFKLNSSYVFKAINFNVIYQHGSYFLSEYATTRRTGINNNYKRLMLSININQSIFSKKLLINSGASYINDYMIGKAPSAYVNLRYAPKERYFVFLNTSWFRYNLSNTGFDIPPTSVASAELGFTFNFKSSKASPGKKGTVQAMVYYDNNGNNIFDKGDATASNHIIVINNTSFQTNTKGQLLYKSVPFGKYNIQSSAQQGWFSKEKEIVLKEYKSNIEIPLHQSGTISGKIEYDIDIRTSLHFEPRFDGIIFNIYNQEGKIVQRISTDDSGAFMSFLPTGTYQLMLDEKSLPDNTYVSDTGATAFSISSGKITSIPTFTIKAKEKKRIVKKFGD
ncbi:hypothetical protein [Niabella aquatica]